MPMDSSFFLAANSPKATLFAKWLTGFLSQISPPFFSQPAILLEIGQLEINNARLCYFT